MSLLPHTISVTFLGALAAYLAGSSRPALARGLALATALLGLVLSLTSFVQAGLSGASHSLVNVPWIPEFGIRFHLTADGISLVLCVLTGIAATAGILFSWNIQHRTNEFFGLFLMLIGGVYGVFLSADAFVFFVFYEIAIVPKYFLIAIWGSTRREYGAMKLVLYSFAGSALVLGGLLWAFAASGAQSFDVAALAAGHYTHVQQVFMFALVFTGFAILAGLVPFHTWAPTGHVAAPTGASMLLAGVVMKLGAYGCLRVALPLFPDGFAFWQSTIGALAVIGIVYAGVAALTQGDLKFVIAYSSVSHMGFVMLGLAAGITKALVGSVMQMVSHGIIAGLLFAVVGRMVYERTHTRKLDDLRALPLFKLLPFPAAIFVVAGIASMGMPGFSGFPSELAILVGSWKSHPIWTGIAAAGIVVAGAFTLRAVALSFFGTKESTHDAHLDHPSITWPEYAGAALLLAASLLIGFRPDLVATPVAGALNTSFFQSVAVNVVP